MPPIVGMTPQIKASLVPASGFKRSHNRFAIELDISLQILIPEETFTPRGIEGKTIDISARGMKIVALKLPPEMYTKLIKGTRYMRVVFTSPIDSELIKMTGQIAWFDYHKPSEANAGQCFMGIQFDEKSGPGIEAYEKMLSSIRSA
jgi:hypothetical protein